MSADDYQDHTPLTERGRFPYFIEGKITNVNDDAGLGRIKCRLKGMEDSDETDWLAPAWPGSIEAVPNVDELVWVQFIEGDPAHGLYLWFPTKNTQHRPVEAMMLGTMFVGMFNFLVTQFNQLKSDFSNHGHSPGTFTSATGGLVTGVSSAAKAVAASLVPGAVGSGSSATTAVDANKGKASDGSVVADKSSSEVVLSGKAKVR